MTGSGIGRDKRACMREWNSSRLVDNFGSCKSATIFMTNPRSFGIRHRRIAAVTLVPALSSYIIENTRHGCFRMTFVLRKWPTAISYAVSYLFIAIIWINHHHLMRFVGPPTLGLIWINFVHLFMVSLLPFATAWIARTRLASSPVAFYAGLFVCIDVAYNVFEHQVLAHADAQVSARMRRMARRRLLVVLASFTTAMLVAIAARRLRSHMRRPDPPFATRSSRP